MTCTVVVAGFTAIWALAVSVANAIRMKKQNQNLDETICAQTPAVVCVEDLIFCAFPS
jgi:hypothetical protein